MAYGVGDTISEGFSTGIAGETFTINKSRDPNADTFTPTFTDLGDGDYLINVAVDTAGSWFVRWTGNTSGQEFSVTWQVVTAQQANPVQYLSGQTVEVVSPVAASGMVTIYQGDDYDSNESRALTWTLTGASDLTGATVTLTIAKGNTQLVSQVGAVGTPGAATQTVTVELTAAQTAVLPVGAQAAQYDLSATLANGHEETLARGRVTVAEDIP